MSRPLDGRRVAVAGAGGGLGPTVVRALADAGAWVAAADRTVDHCSPVAEIADVVHGVDLLTAAGAQQWADAVGPVDAVLHLVGGWRGGKSVEDMDLADLDLLEDLLFHTVVHTTRAFAPLLKAAGARGRFALVSSSVVGHPTAGNAAYAATKAAAEAWTLTLASELAETGGTANVAVVTAIATPQMREENPDKAYKSFTDVGEIADALVFLCSDAARKMNGQRLHLHG
ncbi:3-oxoacyl-[acyl-carrier-protein] reductase FabG [Baekduia alba]|uniref:SDR family NAD(P)-dependent oxidoreductase n=1 Tax=Baekduia alba TaxID=2997333 RepID=UPI00233FF70C|nr:SDR family NAD(P)-dependent oxidoreductase [Baekduia alba]WCB95051.1 3-oxoacyl-[acyl-carrier-protein] reductase FabG [Baekduia alba]